MSSEIKGTAWIQTLRKEQLQQFCELNQIEFDDQANIEELQRISRD